MRLFHQPIIKRWIDCIPEGYRLPLLFASLLHLLLFILLFVHESAEEGHKVKNSIHSAPAIVNAVIINSVANSKSLRSPPKVEKPTQPNLQTPQVRQSNQAFQPPKISDSQSSPTEPQQKSAEAAAQQTKLLEQQKQAAAAAAAMTEKLKQQQQQLKIAAEKAQAMKVQAEKIAAEKATEEKALAEKAAAQKAAAEKAAAEKAAAEKAAALKAEQLLKQQQAEKAAQLKAAELKKQAEAAEKAKLLEQQKQAAAEKAAAAKKAAEQAKKLELAAEQKKLQQQLMQQQLAQEQADLEKEKETQEAVDQYTSQIRDSIRPKWLIPSAMEKKVSLTVKITTLNDGTVTNVAIEKSSGNPALDHLAIVAIYKSSPLPLPTDQDLASHFHVFDLTMTPPTT